MVAYSYYCALLRLSCDQRRLWRWPTTMRLRNMHLSPWHLATEKEDMMAIIEI